MLFRTEVDIRACKDLQISHNDAIFMLGSCFTDNVGMLLERDGFDVTHNPMGPLYHPIPLLGALRRYMGEMPPHTPSDFAFSDLDGKWHCLDFPSRYADADPSALAQRLNAEIDSAAQKLQQASVVIITLGSAFAYDWLDDGHTVGNCHKFPPQRFCRHLVDLVTLTQTINDIISLLKGKQLIFTVSPIRHLADGTHGNQISKSSLLLALESASAVFHYFPSYEIMMDDLRDYRFYAADMKHPSDVAVDYIYSKFANAYFAPATVEQAAKHRAAAKFANHISLNLRQ